MSDKLPNVEANAQCVRIKRFQDSDFILAGFTFRTFFYVKAVDGCIITLVFRPAA